jgi:hypothetical protein
LYGLAIVALFFGDFEGDQFQFTPLNGIVRLDCEKPQGMNICVEISYEESFAASPACFLRSGSVQSFIDQQWTGPLFLRTLFA